MTTLILDRARCPSRRSPSYEALPKVRRVARINAASAEPPPSSEPSVFRHHHSASPDASLPTNLGGLTIVVVDDDESSLDYFAAALRACGGTVLSASNATDALQLIREHRPDVVLSDLAMDERDGYWLIDAIRRLPGEIVGRVPVVATTAYGPEHSLERTLTAGFVERLRKPVDPVVLCRTIGRVAGR
jgi:CheY-like chemotaxis protein